MSNLNEISSWNGSYIGDLTGKLFNRFPCGLDQIEEYKLDQGIMTCISEPSKGDFTMIIESVKNLFNLQPRGYHRATIDNKIYNLFYVYRHDNKMLYEVPVSSLGRYHPLRKDQVFRQRMQDLLTLIDVMALRGSNENNIRIRKIGDQYYPICYNNPCIAKMESCESVANKSLLSKWFGDEEDYHGPISRLISSFESKTGCLSSQMSSVLEKIISNIDPSYRWYSNLIRRRIRKFSDLLL